MGRTPPKVPSCPPDRVPQEGETIFSRAMVQDYKIDENGCWIWQKALSPAGYPWGNTHRRYYERARGPIPEGYHAHHKCHTPACVNPDHLDAIAPTEHFKIHRLEGNGLTLDDVLEIRERGRHASTNVFKLAEEYGVSWETVRAYWAGDYWHDALGPLDPIVVDQGRGQCQRPGCSNKIPSSRRRDARYCSKRCMQKKMTHVLREGKTGRTPADLVSPFQSPSTLQRSARALQENVTPTEARDA